ncbi:MAG TPA: fatty acid desaturase, partial [Pseudomonadales bacterium]|nr:fatty acid desaturase [Pseudomonadales bacterium]
LQQFKSAFVLEKIKLERNGFGFWHWKNELLWQLAFSALMAGLQTWWYGFQGLIIFACYSFIAICGLQVVLYVSHYGLRRAPLESGKYEKTQRVHSWNSNGIMTDLLSVSIQKHSAHHAMPGSYFHALDVDDNSPLLPASYYLMYALALIPAWWFKVMDPRVDAVMNTASNTRGS